MDLFVGDPLLKIFNCGGKDFNQGRRVGTSSVPFEVLIMNCEIDFINLFIICY